MSQEKFEIGDKVYFVEKETDCEIEGYIFKDLGDDVWVVKIREGRSFAYLPGYRLTWIDPPNWETLEENLERSGVKEEENNKEIK